MSPIRWVIFITALVTIGWLHLIFIEPKPPQPAVRGLVKQLHMIGDDRIAVNTSGGDLYLWALSDLSAPQIISSGISAVARPLDDNAVAFFEENHLKVYDLETGVETLSAELRSYSSNVASYNPNTQEMIAQTKDGVQTYDTSGLPENLVESRLLYPPTSTRDSSEQQPPLDLKLLPGPSGAFAVYDNANGELWRYFPGPDDSLEKADDLTEEPRILWASDGESFAYHLREEAHVHVVNRTCHYDWPAPAPSSDGTLWIGQLTTHAVTFADGDRVHFHDFTNGNRTRTTEYGPLHSLPPLDRPKGESSYHCRSAVSDNLRFLMLNCEFRKFGRTSVTDLSTMETIRFKRYDTIGYRTLELLVSNTGASILGHGNRVQFIAAGSGKPKAVIDPSIVQEPKSQLLWWVYRVLVLMLAFSMVVSMNRFNNQAIHTDSDYGVASLAASLFFTLRSSAIVMVPVVLFFVWFAIQVITGKDETFGGNHPGLSLIIGGLMVLVALVVVGVVAAVAAVVGSTIARAWGATPANAALITPICVYAGLLLTSFWF